ncbi:MAG: DNA polymerase III subunit delta [Candidatus Omnitrophica bacterium]|nr:DNA polymerase III subunit delta [Candidatus Omnitrophota bacterium]
MDKKYAVYFFCGGDEFRKSASIERAKNKLSVSSNSLDYDLYYGKDAASSDIIQALTTSPASSTHRLLVLKDADKLAQEDKNKLISYFKNPVKSAIFILTTRKPSSSDDPIITAARQHAKCVDFPLLKGQELFSWIMQEFKNRNKSAEPAAVEFIKNNIGADLNAINNSVEQICLYTGKREKATLADVKALIGEAAEVSAFNLVDQISQKKRQKAMETLLSLVESGKDTHEILGLIAWNVRRLGRAKAMLEQGKTSEEISAAMKISFYMAQKLIGQAGNFTLREIKKAQRLLIETDFSLKRSASSPYALLETLVMRLSSSL